MVVGPEYNAIMGVALGIDRRNGRQVARGLLALVAGFLAAIALTLLFGLVIRGSGETPEAFYQGVRPVSALISSPDVFSVVVAVLAGIVGVVSLTESRAGALIGVFISITTIPAAANMGLSIAYADWDRALGSTYQLLLNVVVLIVVGALVMRLQRRIWRTRSGPSPRPRACHLAALGQPSRCCRCSPTRIALAIAVRAGFTAPMLGMKLVSTT